MIHREKDVITGNSDLESLYTYKRFPVFMGCVDSDISNDVFEDMRWQISKSSGMIQLNPLLPLNIVYQIGHGSGTTGKLWDLHHTEFSKFISTYSPNKVLEIGGCHGVLAKKYNEINHPLIWTIVEPNPNIPDNIPVKIIKGFFDESFVPDQKYDAIVHSHVLEHIYDINSFLKHASSCLEEGCLMLFSIPNMQVMMERNYTNCINFEHTIFLSEYYIHYLLSRHGFELENRQYFMDDHSIFYCAKKAANVIPVPLPENLYNLNKTLFEKHIKTHLQRVKKLNDSINNFTHIYLFGAHVFSQYLLSYGLDSTKIISILDNDSKKQGKRLYGTNLKVESPKNSKYINGSAIILMAGVYNNEIRNDILQNITKNVTFLE